MAEESKGEVRMEMKFKDRFPAEYEAYRDKVRRQERVKYGRYATLEKDGPANPILYKPCKTMEDAEHLINTMAARGNYPIMAACDAIAINGDCGLQCPVLKEGDCGFIDERIDDFGVVAVNEAIFGEDFENVEK